MNQFDTRVLRNKIYDIRDMPLILHSARTPYGTTGLSNRKIAKENSDLVHNDKLTNSVNDERLPFEA